jgi:hypothetical protein
LIVSTGSKCKQPGMIGTEKNHFRGTQRLKVPQFGPSFQPRNFSVSKAESSWNIEIRMSALESGGPTPNPQQTGVPKREHRFPTLILISHVANSLLPWKLSSSHVPPPVPTRPTVPRGSRAPSPQKVRRGRGNGRQAQHTSHARIQEVRHPSPPWRESSWDASGSMWRLWPELMDGPGVALGPIECCHNLQTVPTLMPHRDSWAAYRPTPVIWSCRAWCIATNQGVFVTAGWIMWVQSPDVW